MRLEWRILCFTSSILDFLSIVASQKLQKHIVLLLQESQKATKVEKKLKIKSRNGWEKRSMRDHRQG